MIRLKAKPKWGCLFSKKSVISAAAWKVRNALYQFLAFLYYISTEYKHLNGHRIEQMSQDANQMDMTIVLSKKSDEKVSYFSSFFISVATLPGMLLWLMKQIWHIFFTTCLYLAFCEALLLSFQKRVSSLKFITRIDKLVR